jgi:hypothetical protein
MEDSVFRQDLTKLPYLQIGGSPKSGTSLLLALLDGHPEVAVYPGETGHTGYLYPTLNDPRVSLKTKLDTIIDYRCSLESYGYIPVEACNYIEVGETLRSYEDDIGNNFIDVHSALLQAFYEVFDPQHLSKSRLWVDKSPFSHLFADDIFSVFPDAKFIHILREPKDNFASVGGSVLKRRRSRVVQEALLWRYRVWTAQSLYFAKRNQEKYGASRYFVIRFRDLVQKPKEIVPKLVDFIGISENETLYMPTRGGCPYLGNNKEGLEFRGIFSGNVDRWMERIPDYYACVMECQPEGYLQYYDYIEHFNLSLRRKALRTHRLLTTFIPRSTSLRKFHLYTLFGKFHPYMYKQPAAGVPGIF